jgi:GntR family transcriptional repressor for pyruvate dehydrogenase complex
MIAQFAVSKGTVREAMRILEAQGLIVTRTGPGGGSFVGGSAAERAKALLANYFYFEELSIADIYQLRKAAGAGARRRDGRTSDAPQLDELRDLATRYDRPAQSPEEERDQHVTSLRFHETLAEFAGNPLLSFCVSFMARMLSDLTVYRRLYEPHNEELWSRAGSTRSTSSGAGTRATRRRHAPSCAPTWKAPKR